MVVGGGMCVIGVGFVGLGVVYTRVKKLYIVVWACVAGVIGGFLCGMEHGVGKAMLMRGGPCAAKRHLMRVGGWLDCE